MGKNNGGEIIVSEWCEHDFDYYFNKQETFFEAVVGIVENCKRLINEYRVRFRVWKRIAKGGSIVVWK